MILSFLAENANIIKSFGQENYLGNILGSSFDCLVFGTSFSFLTSLVTISRDVGVKWTPQSSQSEINPSE